MGGRLGFLWFVVLAAACARADAAPVATSPDPGDRLEIPTAAVSAPTLVVQVAKASGANRPVQSGDVVDVCVSPEARLRDARVVAVYCRRASPSCSALVSFDGKAALYVLQAYDAAHPPVAATSGDSCPP